MKKPDKRRPWQRVRDAMGFTYIVHDQWYGWGVYLRSNGERIAKIWADNHRMTNAMANKIIEEIVGHGKLSA